MGIVESVGEGDNTWQPVSWLPPPSTEMLRIFLPQTEYKSEGSFLTPDFKLALQEKSKLANSDPQKLQELKRYLELKAERGKTFCYVNKERLDNGCIEFLKSQRIECTLISNQKDGECYYINWSI